MEPVGHQDRLYCFVPGGAARSVDCQGAVEAVGVLRLVVGVVPGVAVLGQSETIGEALAGCDGA